MKHPSPTSRLLALDVLCTWHDSHTSINGIFDHISNKFSLESRDIHLANALIFGVLRQQQYLDYIISTFAKHPLRKMKPRTLMALRLGIFQLLLLDRIPESAAVNETVNAFKTIRQPKWLVNFVNGVLRNVARQKETLPTPETAVMEGNLIVNHPQWMVSRWQQYYGREKTSAICTSNNILPVLTLRTNTVLISREKLLTLFAEKKYQARPGVFSPEAICLAGANGSISGLPGYEQGFFQVQDEAAQLATHLMPMQPGEKYLDCCAGLGGKTSHLAALAPENTHITALEPEKRRFHLLGENLNRLGCSTKVTACRSTLEKRATEEKNRYEAILVDAPCSGTGVIRRQPDIRWNRKLQDLTGYQQQQLQLLETASSLLRTNGIVVYATCSLEPEENEEVIQTFLNQHPHFSLENATAYLPPAAGHLVNRQGYFQPTPADGLDGFFAARLRHSPSS